MTDGPVKGLIELMTRNVLSVDKRIAVITSVLVTRLPTISVDLSQLNCRIWNDCKWFRYQSYGCVDNKPYRFELDKMKTEN